MPASTDGGKKLPDGIFGVETAATVVSFQRANGLKADGLVGPKTLERLETLLIADAQAESARLVLEVQGPRAVRRFVSGSNKQR